MNRTCPMSARQLPAVTHSWRVGVPAGNSLVSRRWSSVGGASVILATLLAFLSEPASAQVPKPKVPASAKPGTKTVPKPKPKLEPSEELKIDSETLPPGFKPTPERLAIMDLDAPIATKEELDKLNKEAGRFFKVKNECDMSPEGRKTVHDSIRAKLAALTLREPLNRTDASKEDPNYQLRQLPLLHRKLVEDLANVGGQGAVRPADKAKFVEFLGQEVVKQMPELLKNNFYARIHGVMILGEIDYWPAYELLLQVIQAKDIRVDPENGQPEAIKIAAAMGLVRILRYADPVPPPKDRNIMAHAILEELKKTDTHWWLQSRLIEALRYCDINGMDAANNNQPFIVNGLISLIADEEREWMVRAKACYALGRVPLPASVNPNDVITVVAKFAKDMADAAAAKPGTQWKECFWDLYLAFHANDRGKVKDLDAERKMAGGFLTRIKSTAQPLYDLIVPMVNDVRANKVPNATSRQNLDAFVKGRNPIPNVQAGVGPKGQ